MSYDIIYQKTIKLAKKKTQKTEKPVNLTWSNSAVESMDPMSWLMVISTVITGVISCYNWWDLLSLICKGKKR